MSFDTPFSSQNQSLTPFNQQQLTKYFYNAPMQVEQKSALEHHSNVPMLTYHQPALDYYSNSLVLPPNQPQNPVLFENTPSPSVNSQFPIFQSTPHFDVLNLSDSTSDLLQATTTAPTPKFHPGTTNSHKNNHLHVFKPTPVVNNSLRSRFKKAEEKSKAKFNPESAAQSIDTVFNQLDKTKPIITNSFIESQFTSKFKSTITIAFKEMISTHQVLKNADGSKVMTLLNLLNFVLIIIDGCKSIKGDFFATYNSVLTNHPDKEILKRKKETILHYFRNEMLKIDTDFSRLLTTVVSLFFNLDPDPKRLINVDTYMKLTNYTILMVNMLDVDETSCVKLLDNVQNVISPYLEHLND